MIFDELTDSEMGHVEKMGTLKAYKPEEMVVQEGRPGTSFFLVVNGKVEVRSFGGPVKRIRKRLSEIKISQNFHRNENSSEFCQSLVINAIES